MGSIDGKIVGGEEADLNEFPWQAALQKKRDGELFCGASVISDQWLLTAAHCDVYNKNEIVVSLGEHDMSTDAETRTRKFKVKRWISHPNYNDETTDFDFALVKLKRRIDFTATPNIRPICLPKTTGPRNKLAGKTCTISGWGSLSHGGSSPDILQKAEVSILKRRDCTSD